MAIKTVQVKACAMFIQNADKSYLKNGVLVKEAGPMISLAQVLAFKKSIPALQAATLKELKPYILKGGFIFDPALYQWSVYMAPGNKFIAYYVTITFVDADNEGAKTFMKYVAATGLLNGETDIVKPYG